LKDGYKPIDPAHWKCINPQCQHQYIDEPDTNKTAHQSNLTAMREHQKKKKEAKDNADKQESKLPRIQAPKMAPIY
jgi:hypothetical protein